MSYLIRRELATMPGTSPIRVVEVWGHCSVTRAGERRWESRTEYVLDVVRIQTALDVAEPDPGAFAVSRGLRDALVQLLAGDPDALLRIRVGASHLTEIRHWDGARPEGFYDNGGSPGSAPRYGRNWSELGQSVKYLIDEVEAMNWDRRWPARQDQLYATIESCARALAVGERDDTTLSRKFRRNLRGRCTTSAVVTTSSARSQRSQTMKHGLKQVPSDRERGSSAPLWVKSNV